MKIRNGFVSNSSSSSYIVKIRDTYWDEFCDIVESNKGSDSSEELISEIDKCLKEEQKSAQEDSVSTISSGILEFWKQARTERIKELNRIKGMLSAEKVSNSTLIKAALDLHGIKYIETNKDVVELVCSTSMHNSFNEGMPELLKEIVLLFMFDTKKKVECERTDHGN